MTHDELNDIVSAARARQPDITPAPWHYDKYRRGIFYKSTVPVVSAEVADNVEGYSLWFSNRETMQLITDAPRLNAAVIAMADELEAARARIATLERKVGYLEAHTIYNDPFKA